MPLLLGYLSSLNEAKIGHVTKAFYALENFLENLGEAKKKQQLYNDFITVYLSDFCLPPSRGRYRLLPSHPDGDDVVHPQQLREPQD